MQKQRHQSQKVNQTRAGGTGGGGGGMCSNWHYKIEEKKSLKIDISY